MNPYIHFLMQGERGWYTPREFIPPEVLEGPTFFAIPVESDGSYFPKYWAQAIVLNNGITKLLDQPFEARASGDFLIIDLSFATIRFTVSKDAMSYLGRFTHPDFIHSFKAITSIDGEVVEQLFLQHKTVIIGLDSDEYNLR